MILDSMKCHCLNDTLISAESDVGPSYQSAGSRTDIHYARP
jgi:hypothetical protein